MSNKKDTTDTTFKTPLLNDCTNHLAFQLKRCRKQNETQQAHVDLPYESPVADIVTHEFIRGYN